MNSRATLVARTEVRRTVRTVVGNRTKLLMMAIVALLALGPMTALGVLFLPTFGEEIATGTVDNAMATTIVTGVVALAWIFLIFMAAIRTVTAAADIDQPAVLLLSAPLRSTVIGIVCAEILLFAIWLVPPVVVFSAAFASGAGTVLPALAIPAVALLLLVTAVPVGFVIGTWVRHLLTVYEPIARYRTPLIIVLAVAYFGSISLGWFDILAGMLFDVLGDGPLGWFGHLFLLGVPNVDPSMGAIVGALVGSAVLVPLMIGAGVVSARVHWYADPARVEDDAKATAESESRLDGVLEYGLSKQLRTLTLTTIRRTKRAPIRLMYAAYPLFGSLFFAQEIIQTGAVPSYIAVMLCLYVVWGTGVLFSLNPLGDLGQTLPAVLSSPVNGTTMIRSRMIASSLVGVPLGVLVALAAGLASPISLESTAVLLAGTVLGALASPALAVGVGSAFPRFGSVSITGNREAVMPSKMSFVVYTAGIIFPIGAAVVLYTDAAALVAQIATAMATMLPQVEVGLTASQVTMMAWIVVAIGVVAPPVAYRYAVERFDWYAIE
ncbi:hypothetical protein [Natrialba asiatica]|uniref:Uncharacterized protein n=1 Tax=Natrialba asiatica (strain ATCC 700177 / DSM 12278 / JCM 9576 / FERM P-10747 / NBRC 102637 / 172P1) TaxID=29540 RepID=M0ALY2_NATA1|nr:hypothetical protein [Natrialba asiatica]ELY99524.1 hypothetical protein C481_14863 [Natrialba asiatica DSM 12278]